MKAKMTLKKVEPVKESKGAIKEYGDGTKKVYSGGLTPEEYAEARAKAGLVGDSYKKIGTEDYNKALLIHKELEDSYTSDTEEQRRARIAANQARGGRATQEAANLNQTEKDKTASMKADESRVALSKNILDPLANKAIVDGKVEEFDKDKTSVMKKFSKGAKKMKLVSKGMKKC